MIDNSQEDLSTIESIVSVKANELKNGKIQIVAIDNLGKNIVLKKQSTMEPEFVFFYDFRANGSTRGLGAYATFGKNPSSFYKSSVIKSLSVQYT